MIGYIVRRLCAIVPVLLAVSTIVFVLIHAIPGDPLDVIIGEQAMPADRAALAHELGLDRPLMAQYGSFLKGLVTGDWGRSIVDGRPVTAHLRERFAATLMLAAAAMFVAVAVAIPAGTMAAAKRGSLWDSIAMLVAVVGISVPNFWLGPVLILLFSVYLGVLPIAGIESPASLVLPAVTLGAALAAMLSRMTRQSMIEELGQEYVMTARAKGLSERSVIFKHAFRNALNPVITMVGLQVGSLMAGTIVTEKIFLWPGVGLLLMESIARRDYPVVQGCILIIAAVYVIVNTMTDILYAEADPRVRLA